MISTIEHRVLPAGTKATVNGHQTELLQLSDIDLLMPKLYVHMIELFELDAAADRDKIIDNLVKGLALTLVDYPVLAGTLHFYDEAKRIVVKKTPESSVGLYVRTAGTESKDDIPPFSYLAENHFPVQLLDASKVLPAAFVGQFPVPGAEVDSVGPPAMALQVTFIEGGLILGLAVTHQVCDGPGCETFFSALARHSAAVTKHEGNFPTTNGLNHDMPSCSLMTAPIKPSPEMWKKLDGKFPTFKANDGPPASPPADFKPPAVKSRIWHIPKSKLDQLKAEASKPIPDRDDGRISTYDALLALTWRAVVRAKVPLLNPKPDASSKAIHAVNVRKRADPPLPESYIGVGVTLPQSKTLTITDVVADKEQSLPLLARTVRGATNSVTAQYVSDFKTWAAGLSDLRWTELDMHWVLGLDCMAFDWHTMASYQEHDYGFGRPRAVRWPHPQLDGFFFVLPTRAGIPGADANEGLEIILGLEETCYPRLETDVEWLAYAEGRGLDA